MADSVAEDKTTGHSALLVAKWEWTTNADAGRWSNSQQAIKPKRVHGPTSAGDPNNDGHEIWFSKLKIRGAGKALVLRYESEDGKDFQIVGWAIPFTADSVA